MNSKLSKAVENGKKFLVGFAFLGFFFLTKHENTVTSNFYFIFINI